MRQRSWDVLGMDVSAHAAREAERTYGVPVHVGTLPHPAVTTESFDVVNMGSVLEHVHWPHRLVEEAVKALKPGALLAVSVPTSESCSVRTFGPCCSHLDLPRHLPHFSPATLRRLLHAHGLEVQELRMLGRASWMRRTLAAAARAEGASLRRRWLGRVG